MFRWYVNNEYEPDHITHLIIIQLMYEIFNREWEDGGIDEYLSEKETQLVIMHNYTLDWFAANGNLTVEQAENKKEQLKNDLFSGIVETLDEIKPY